MTISVPAAALIQMLRTGELQATKLMVLTPTRVLYTDPSGWRIQASFCQRQRCNTSWTRVPQSGFYYSPTRGDALAATHGTNLWFPEGSKSQNGSFLWPLPHLCCISILVLTEKRNLGNYQTLLKQILYSLLKANPVNTQEMYDVPFLILCLCTHCPSLLIVTQVITLLVFK